jgi:predicted enzyme related to lactoylglutathione lyase
MLETTKAFSAFSTNDIQVAKNFYQSTLGLEVIELEMGILELHTHGNNPIIIYPKPNHEPATFTVLNFPVVDIEKAVDQLIAKGIIFEQYDGDISTDAKGICRSDRGPNIAWFKDPSGNILSLIERTN